MNLRTRRQGEKRFFPLVWREKPAKIRTQSLAIKKEFPRQPHRMSLYQIEKVAQYPSIVHQQKAQNHQRRSMLRQQRKQCLGPEMAGYPTVHMRYQPMYPPNRGYQQSPIY